MNKFAFLKALESHEAKPVTMGYDNGKRFYECDGGRFASVTTMLSATKPQRDIDALQKWRDKVGEIEAARISKDSTERGSDMHAIIESYLKNENKEMNVRQDAIKLFEQMIPALNLIDWWALELFVFSKRFNLAGRLDCLGMFNNQLTLIDFKTSTKKKYESYIKDYYLQVTTYAMMCKELFGLEINQGLILISTPNNGVQQFVFNPNKWVDAVNERVYFFSQTNTT